LLPPETLKFVGVKAWGSVEEFHSFWAIGLTVVAVETKVGQDDAKLGGAEW
jgi:hypothetical protein